jgi:SOS response regulatory protein OraA/RecX
MIIIIQSGNSFIKKPEIKKVSPKDKKKIIRSLQTKGYEFGTIMETWKK